MSDLCSSIAQTQITQETWRFYWTPENEKNKKLSHPLSIGAPIIEASGGKISLKNAWGQDRFHSNIVCI
jgi:hypothetical protein